MQINEKITITFSEEDVKDLIKKDLEAKGYSTQNIKIKLNKKQWTEGHGIMEYDYEELVFEGVEVEAKKDIITF